MTRRRTKAEMEKLIRDVREHSNDPQPQGGMPTWPPRAPETVTVLGCTICHWSTLDRSKMDEHVVRHRNVRRCGLCGWEGFQEVERHCPRCGAPPEERRS